jgi:hypothetical protein
VAQFLFWFRNAGAVIAKTQGDDGMILRKPVLAKVASAYLLEIIPHLYTFYSKGAPRLASRLPIHANSIEIHHCSDFNSKSLDALA